MATDLVAAEGQQHRRKKARFMSDSDIAGRVRLLTPDTRNLNIADKRCHPYNTSGVALCRVLYILILYFILRTGNTRQPLLSVKSTVKGFPR